MSDGDMLTPSDSAVPAEVSAPAEPLLTSGPTWLEQDSRLRDLWMKNKTPQEISEILGRSTAAIMTRAARLGLPRRSAPGRKPGSRRSTPDGEIRRVARPATLKPLENPGASQTSTRICLMCLRPFQSQGRHNRICQSCKNSSDYNAAVALSDINFPV